MMIFNARGKALAEIRFGGQESVFGGNSDVYRAYLFNALKNIPREFLRVDIRYFGLGFDSFVPLTVNRKGREMDIQSALRDAEELSAPDKNQEPSKILFIAPRTEVMPDDGVLSFCTVESIFDFDKVPERSVVMMGADQLGMLRVVCDNSRVFNLELRVITGLPEADYSADFDSTIWALDKVAYLPFLSELKLAAEIQDQLREQELTAHDRERQTYTRKSGLVKEHVKFDVVVPSEGESDDSAVE